MKTLEEHNKIASRKYLKTDMSQYQNNIACPECGEELYDSEPHVVLTSIPPQKGIHCENCDYKGTRVA